MTDTVRKREVTARSGRITSEARSPVAGNVTDSASSRRGSSPVVASEVDWQRLYIRVHDALALSAELCGDSPDGHAPGRWADDGVPGLLRPGSAGGTASTVGADRPEHLDGGRRCGPMPVPACLTRRRPRLQGSPTPSGALRASTPRSWLSARQSATRIGMHLLALCAVRQGHKREEGPAPQRVRVNPHITLAPAVKLSARSARMRAAKHDTRQHTQKHSNG
jgi:hypothetical protein